MLLKTNSNYLLGAYSADNCYTFYMKSMTLIHTALFCEAKSIIEHFKMRCIQKKPYRIYSSDSLVLIVSGIGAKKTALHVEDSLKRHEFIKAINLGIAGCKDESVEIGTLYCTNHKLSDIDHLTLSSHDKAIEDKNALCTTLVDMEANSFLKICKEHLSSENLFVFKVVSDHLSAKIPQKSFVEGLIKNSIKIWEKYV